MKLRKIITMGLAAVMAVSAMSISAFACENKEDAVISVLAADGINYLYLSQEDIDNGQTSLTGFEGITVSIVNPVQQKTMRAFASLPKFTSNQPEGIASIDNAYYEGSYSVPKSQNHYSRNFLECGDSNNALIQVDKDSNFNKKVTFSLMKKDGPEIATYTPSSSGSQGFVASNLAGKTTYMKIANTMDATASGYISIKGY